MFFFDKPFPWNQLIGSLLVYAQQFARQVKRYDWLLVILYIFGNEGILVGFAPTLLNDLFRDKLREDDNDRWIISEGLVNSTV